MRAPVPIGGSLSLPLRLFGIRRSRMNPNLCTVCELMFCLVMCRRNVEAELTIPFADLRGYTALSRTLGAAQVHELLGAFYDECAGAIWERNGLLNKTVGDAVMGVLNFPIARPDHTRQAVSAARELQRRCAAGRAGLVARGASDRHDPVAGASPKSLKQLAGCTTEHGRCRPFVISATRRGPPRGSRRRSPACR
jgi:adenylate cyclase